jgi:hypothetical protein
VSTAFAELTGEAEPKNPIRGTSPDGCARAASGQAAAPPNSEMNWRRVTRSPSTAKTYYIAIENLIPALFPG